MSLLRLIHSLLIALAVALLMAWATVDAVAGPPNFVIFIADDMSWDDCSAYGHPHIRTPHMQRLADEGMRFDRAFLTCSSCSPSRCSILTGRYPSSTGAPELHLPLPAEQVLVSAPLKEAGYWSAAIGKWHLGDAAKRQVDQIVGSPPDKMGEAWVQALRDRPQDRPFFLWAAHSDPHRGYKPGAVDPPHTRDDVVVPPIFPDTPQVRDDLALYYDEVSRFDEHIGMTLAELERQQILDETFILVISDNGRPFPRCKTTVYDDGIRTPFIVRYPPLVKSGQVSDTLISVVDIAPTLLELAEFDVWPTFQGKSLVPVLKDPQATIRRFAFAEHNWHDYAAYERAVRSNQYLYIRNWRPELPGTPPADAVRSPTFAEMQRLHAAGELSEAASRPFVTPRPEEELYDVSTDPHCLRNLAGDAKHEALKQAMNAALFGWRDATGQRLPDEFTPDGFDRTDGTKLPSMTGAHPRLSK